MRELAVIPVIRVSSYEHAICAIEGIMAGGINIAEITLTVPNAVSIIKELSTRYGDDLLVGAGTVLDTESCRAALDAGAEFIVSPALDVEVVKLARQHGKITMPGALTPTEVLAAWKSGADFVKVFPCNSVGGPSYIRSLKGPFPQIEFVVTGSVTVENVSQFIAAGVTAVGVGESVISKRTLDANDAAAIAANARNFLQAIRPG
ncbi:MAG TPA: bifunctional 4-hydroxy-2-oxoglutarate aldolase/2-dehydro-3-deoxy-phosphogluconate aldolase [Terriglobales bacterium]|nr:bifunctional 4-hydroxy-2-oxoglutarate aldolase/2-dehydro-3-deoxy-phosphogluconate aldolase [Terriglobales bacterium]